MKRKGRVRINKKLKVLNKNTNPYPCIAVERHNCYNF